MDRRSFLHDFSHLAAYGAFFPMLNHNLNFSATSLSNTTSPGKILVIIKMNGGNDGLNTVTPLNQYANLNIVRPHVIIPENKLVSLNKNDLALHPSLADLKILSDEKRMKVIQNVGYEQPDFSHFRSMDIWQSASDYNQFVSSGWVGRYVEHNHPEFPENYPNDNYPHPLAIELGHQSSLMFTGKYSFPSFIANNPEHFSEIINDFDHIYPNTYSGDKLKFVQLIAKQSNLYSREVKTAYVNGQSSVDFPQTHIGWQLRTISKLIQGGLNTRIYMVEIGGFDTHDRQVDVNDKTKGEHANILKELNDGIISFISSLDESGDSDRVLTFTFSEFGRTIVSNSSYGTDHGTAAPMFIFGNSLNPSVLGNNPSISPLTQWHDNLAVEYDFRQVYSSIIEQWLGGDEQTEEDVLFKSFPKLGITGQYADQDEDGVPNQFDQCQNTTSGAMVDTNGCEVFNLPNNAFSVVSSSATCSGKNNGEITIVSNVTSHTYLVKVNNELTGELNQENNYTLKVNNLSTGSHSVCISVVGQQTFVRCYSINIAEPPALSASVSVDNSARLATINLYGSVKYHITHNGTTTTTDKQQVNILLESGNNTLTVNTDLSCQGSFFQEVFVSEKVVLYPNPTSGALQAFVAGLDQSISLVLRDLSGGVRINRHAQVPQNRVIELDLTPFPSGIYVLMLSGQTIRSSEKIIKK